MKRFKEILYNFFYGLGQVLKALGETLGDALDDIDFSHHDHHDWDHWDH